MRGIKEAQNKTASGIMIERIVHWSLNGVAQAPFLCTPDALVDLAAGHLLTTGRVSSYEDIKEIKLLDKRISVFTTGNAAPPCPIDERLSGLTPLQSNLTISLQKLREYADRLTGEESFYGTHRIMLHSKQEEITCEDIGRHNAADKVIGAAARMGWDFSQCLMGATGRISLEILFKAAVMGIPVLFSKKYPSDLAGSEADRLHIAIAGKIQSAEPELSGAVYRFEMDG
ncbi:MAG: hypothetical protein GX781_08010 [Clostridiales bacterium]|nr:hypothetical protein [Clostridiales bacterium]